MDAIVRSILKENSRDNAAAHGVTSETPGLRVRQLRSALGLTQSALAAKSGICHSALSKVENSQRSPTFQTLLRIAGALVFWVSTPR